MTLINDISKSKIVSIGTIYTYRKTKTNLLIGLSVAPALVYGLAGAVAAIFLLSFYPGWKRKTSPCHYII